MNVSNFEECICRFSILSVYKGKVNTLNMLMYASIGEFHPFKCISVFNEFMTNCYFVIHIYLCQLLKSNLG